MASRSRERLRKSAVVETIVRYSVAAVALGFVPTTLGLSIRANVERLRREWTIAGPPCPAWDQAWRNSRWGALKMSFDYMDIRYAYGRGMAYCADIPKRGWGLGSYQVCQFANPGILTVDLEGATYRFGPFHGHRATIVVIDGAPRCVIGGWFGARAD